jgi:hypothetical protein
MHRRNDMLLKLLDVFWLAFRVASDEVKPRRPRSA